MQISKIPSVPQTIPDPLTVMQNAKRLSGLGANRGAIKEINQVARRVEIKEKDFLSENREMGTLISPAGEDLVICAVAIPHKIKQKYSLFILNDNFRTGEEIPNEVIPVINENYPYLLTPPPYSRYCDEGRILIKNEDPEQIGPAVLGIFYGYKVIFEVK